MINAEGAALEDRFADGWTTSDVASTDPGVADGAAAGCTPWSVARWYRWMGSGRLRCRRIRPDARPDRGYAVPQRPPVPQW
ncbi:lipolpqB domain protein [Mycobacterium xenopi 3993]|nr:lipolpqB domain protein [Mycobacterium xenopi 3993]